MSFKLAEQGVDRRDVFGAFTVQLQVPKSGGGHHRLNISRVYVGPPAIVVNGAVVASASIRVWARGKHDISQNRFPPYYWPCEAG